MSISELQVQTALKEITDPNTGKDFIATKSARNIKVSGSDVSLDIELGYPAKTPVRTDPQDGARRNWAPFRVWARSRSTSQARSSRTACSAASS